MEIMFVLVPVFIAVIFVVVIGTILYKAAAGLAEWQNNNQQPTLSVPAHVVTKRTEVVGHGTGNSGYNSTTYYYATFDLEGGERKEFWISGKEYGLLAEGDVGTLTYQGTRYHGFQRQVSG